jgi:hypothetical protein
MKTARILLAVLSLAALGACGNDPITGPGSMTPGSARHETSPAPKDDAPTDNSGSEAGTTGETSCTGTVAVTTDSSGNIIYTCVAAPAKGGQYGSGG